VVALPEPGKRPGWVGIVALVFQNHFQPLYHQVLDRGATADGFDFRLIQQPVRQVDGGFHDSNKYGNMGAVSVCPEKFGRKIRGELLLDQGLTTSILKNMVTHMKTTIEIADSLLLRAKTRAREKNVTLRSLIEESLAATLEKPLESAEILPVTFKGNGLSRDFQDASWDKIRDEIYQ